VVALLVAAAGVAATFAVAAGPSQAATLARLHIAVAWFPPYLAEIHGYGGNCLDVPAFRGDSPTSYSPASNHTGFPNSATAFRVVTGSSAPSA
jgi:hypothetical protein